MQISGASDDLRRIVVSVFYKDALVRAGVAATLSLQPAFVVVDGQQASSTASSRKFLREAVPSIDVVVADYDHALAIAALVKQEDPTQPLSSIKIIIVSPRDGEAEIRHALQQGIHGYIALSCPLEEMEKAVVAVYRGHRHLGQSVAQRIAESFDHEALTGREIAVLRLVVTGYANKMIAKELDIALGTVKSHVKSILGKLRAKTRTEAAAVSQRRGLFGRFDELALDGFGSDFIPPRNDGPGDGLPLGRQSLTPRSPLVAQLSGRC
jgi:DNA-binding NarL/FixJ family response regulator